MSTLRYSVTFSESVTGFVANNISISGTANNEKPEISNFNGGGSSYTFEAQSGSTDGTIIVGIPASVVTANPKSNTASEYINITIDTTGPALLSASLIDERTIRLYFSEPVKNNFVNATDFVFTNNTLTSVSNVDKGISVSTIAGNGTAGDVVGNLSSARFDGLNDVLVLPNGTLLVLDVNNRKIKSVTPDGVRTFFDIANSLGTIRAFTQDQDGSIYVAASPDVLKIFPDGQPSIVVTGTSSFGIGASLNGSLYVSSPIESRIAKVNPIDGSLVDITIPATTLGLSSITVASNGTVYVSAPNRDVIYGITQGVPDVYAGVFLDTRYTGGNVDTNSTTTGRIVGPKSLAFSPSGILYVSDTLTSSIREIPSTNIIYTLAGDLAPGFADGNKTTARFGDDSGIDVGPDGTVYVADKDNNALRQIKQYSDFYDVTLGQSVGISDSLTLEYTPSVGTFDDIVGQTANSATVTPRVSGPILSIATFNVTDRIVVITIDSNETTTFILNSLTIGSDIIAPANVSTTSQNSSSVTYTYIVSDPTILGLTKFNITAGDAINRTTITEIDYHESLHVLRPSATTTLHSFDVKPGYPTSLSTLRYSVTFNASVTGFTASNIFISGTANKSNPEVSNFIGSGTFYTFEVQRGETDGNVTVGIPKNTALNNIASEYITVTIDTTRPTPTISLINETTIRLTFSEPVKNNFVNASDFVISNATDSVSGSNVDMRVDVSTLAGDGTRGDTVGKLASATFDRLNDTLVLPNGTILVLDRDNYKIKRVNSTHVGTVFDLNNTIIGTPNSIAQDQTGSIYVTSSAGIFKIFPDGVIAYPFIWN